MHDGFLSLEDIIKKNPGLSSVRKEIERSDVILKFGEIFPEFKKIAKAVKVDKGTLFLKVENAAWRSELKFKEKLVIEKINKFFNSDRIKALRFSSK